MVECEPELLEPFCGHGLPELSGVAGVEEEEAPSAGADQFAPDRSRIHGCLVPAVDVPIRHPLGTALFVLPVLKHEFGEPCRIALLECLATLNPESFHHVE